MLDHPPQSIRRSARGEFVIRCEENVALRVRPTADGWLVDGAAIPRTWFLRRDRSAGGFALETGPADHDVARTTALENPGQPRELRYLLLGDGRLFRIALRGPRDSRVELTGWESPGAYLTARPDEDGWRIDPAPASAGIPDILTLSVLFAAEILDSEEPLQHEKSP